MGVPDRCLLPLPHLFNTLQSKLCQLKGKRRRKILATQKDLRLRGGCVLSICMWLVAGICASWSMPLGYLLASHC